MKNVNLIPPSRDDVRENQRNYKGAEIELEQIPLNSTLREKMENKPMMGFRKIQALSKPRHGSARAVP